ncbi:FAD-dependent oxidoreductase [Echinicola sp. CAU 1574]|uniref:FAD-dependent oxidoreductase n=1 Tax=Echinicola arenosa TaxID=2774144 RepID=A0ABR9AMK7_9BACT|nr:FAD-dependent oxidoreductase [Echinicola arenosa]MBD8490034.1 FAD-dependent oxidoreductase [Echinicola arenosa]
MKRTIFTLILSVGAVIAAYAISLEKEVYQADVVIYGGTSAAVIAAVEVSQSGKSVLVVSPDQHLGGLSSGGLGFTDTGNKATIGGLARDFYHRVYQHYQTTEAWPWQERSEYGNKGQGTPAIDGENRTMWIFEPHVAEEVFEDLVKENNIKVFRDEWLDREKGVKLKKGVIKSITMLSGKVFEAEVFIDATYEGDLMASAGVSYHVGRESNDTYGEIWNGIQKGAHHHGHYFKSPVDPYLGKGDASSGLLPYIQKGYPGENGNGDHKIQAYCFRLCMSNHPDNRVPFPKPKNYDPSNYALLARVFESGWDEWFDKFDAIPNRKTDTNNHGPFSSDFIGGNYAYPEASYEERNQIIEAHKQYQQGLLYYVSHDPQVPLEVREKMQSWGLAKDEFTDNGNWPHQLYIREARRMIGKEVMTELEVMGEKPVLNSIGMGSYSIDSHNVQRYVTEEGHVQNEGDIGVHPHDPYSISFGAILPKKKECENLLVPVCVSASHSAFGSVRMEPVFMILGQSAAVTAVLAIDSNIPVQEVDYNTLSKRLVEKEAVLYLEK